MNRDDYLHLSGVEFLRTMFENTRDGVLCMEDDDRCSSETIAMDWDEKALEVLLLHYENLVAALTRLGQEHERWKRSAQDMPQELRQVWDTYVVPYPDHGMDKGKLFMLTMKKGLGEELTPEEQQMLAMRERWMRENAIKRLPYKGCEPMELIEAARRYESVVAMQAPKGVLSYEKLALAEEMAYYYCRKTDTHTCACCGRVYDLAPYNGYVYGSVCPTCDWEQDASGETEFSSTNGTTLADYRQRFEVQRALEDLCDR